jgi:hypothetical protein
MNIKSSSLSWLLAAFAVLLAIIAWIAAVVSLGYAMGDINEADPIRKKELFALHQLITRASLVLFVTGLIGSSWLGGRMFQSNRIAALSVLAVHTAAILGAMFLVFR